MEATCQRCHETLGEGERFCRSCGLPQVTYASSEVPVIEIGRLADGIAVLRAPVTGIPVGAGATGVAWRPALNAAVMLAFPAAILSFVFAATGQSLAVVWMTGAAALAVVFYRRRSQLAVVATGAGARIGLMTGILACWLMLALTGGTAWVERFLYHQSGQMDRDWAQQVEQSMQLSQQTMAGMGVTAASAAEQSQFWRTMMLSPEGHAGMTLFSFALGVVFLLLFAVLGGALGARLAAPSRRPNN